MNWNNIIKYSAVTIVIVLAVTFILTQNPTIKSLITWNSIKEVQTSKGLELPEKETEKQIDNLKQISVSIKDYNYYPNVIKLKKGVPVSMIFDLKTVTGCYKSVNIYGLGIANKVMTQGNNVLTFTPEKTGKFTMQCAMGMGKATIIVEA